MWDSELEVDAQGNVALCKFEHTSATKLGDHGESIWIGPNEGVNRHNEGPNAVQAWYDEERFYDHDNWKCAPGEVCGHYLQVQPKICLDSQLKFFVNLKA